MNSFEANRTTKAVICIFLATATFAIYSQIQDHEFLNFDDRGYVTENVNVQAGLTRESVIWAFTTSHFANWHPVTWLSHMLDYQIYGSDPKGHLLTNLFFHIANSLILFFVFLRITGTLWQSSFVAAMFALHPCNVESVAWIAERKNVLSTLFWLLTMWAYMQYIEKPSIKRHSLMALLFALGLMSKPMLVTLPFVLLLMDYWPLRRLNFGQEKDNYEGTEKNIDKESGILRLVGEKIPLFLLAATSSVATFVVQKSGGMLQTMDAISLPARLTNAMISYLVYLEKTIWPKGLAIFYPHPANDFVLWKGVLCGMVLMGITAISIRLIREARYFTVGWFWYLGTLVPVIGIVQVGPQSMADRYAYIPLIGIFIIIAWGLPALIAKWRYKEKALSISVGIIIPVLMGITWTQVGHWKDSTKVFKHAIRVNDKKYPNSAIIHNNLGVALSAERKYEEAIFHHQMAITLNPKLLKGQVPHTATAHYNLGNALSAKRKIKEATTHYETAIKLKPDFFEAYINFGNALFAQQKIEEAIFHYKMAIKLNPNYAVSHNNLGFALAERGRVSEAIFHYKMAIKLNPDYDEAHSNLKTALLRLEEKMDVKSTHSPLQRKLNKTSIEKVR